MRQQLFEQGYHQEWQHFEQQLALLEGRRKRPRQSHTDFPAAYRRLCHQLSLARERNYSNRLIEHLSQLVLRGHQQLYWRKSRLHTSIIAFVVADFPALIRREWRLCLAATLIFYLPALLLGLFVWLYPELVYSAIPPDLVERVENMYDPAAEHIGRPREAASDFAMFGLYIQHNIGISFRTFAGGIIYGLGSLFFLAYNGLILGALSAHIINVGYQETFFPFIIGHGAFELTAIVFSGAAGLRLGLALLAPGRRTRLQALRDAATVAIKIMYGVILMLLIAAFIEAFWSSIVIPDIRIKYVAGSLFWLLVAFYFLRLGRIRVRRRGPKDASRPYGT